MKALLLLPLLTSCRFLEPSYVELSPYYQTGDHAFTRPVSSFDEETYGLMFTVGWAVGVQYEAMQNLAALDVSKSGQLTMRDEKDTVVNIEQKQGQEAAVSEESMPLPIPDPPKTMEEAWIYLIAIAGLCALLYVATKLGFKLPFARNGKDTK